MNDPSLIGTRKLYTADHLQLIAHVSGKGTPCLLIHGLGDGGFVWDTFSEEWKRGLQIITPDLRGHGDSEWDTQVRYQIHHYAYDVVSILDQLAVKKCIIVGHSLGGSVLAKIVEIEPDRIMGAILVDSSPLTDVSVIEHLRQLLSSEYRCYSSHEEYAAHLVRTRPLISTEIAGKLARGALRQISATEYLPKFDLGVVDALFADCDDAWWWSGLRKFRFPTLIIRGSGSAVFSHQIAQRALAALPQGKLSIVSMSGHAVMTDNPAGFAAAALPFLQLFSDKN